MPYLPEFDTPMETTSEVFLMDCMEGMKQYPDKYFDLAVVDPPYGIDYANKVGKTAGLKSIGGATYKKNYKSKDWDKCTPNKKYFDELFRVSKNQIIWGGNYFTDNLYPSSEWLFWDKDNGATNFSDGELAWSSFNGGLRMVKILWNGMLQYDMKNKENRFHPTQKPIKLYDWIFTKYASPGQKILDTHLGSGSSRIAAHKNELNFIGFETDEDYFKAHTKRWNEFKQQLKLF